MNIDELFYEVDDFYQAYEQQIAQQQLTNERKTPGPKCKLYPSEIMAIIIYFQMSGYRNFKTFYQKHVCCYWQSEFPNLVSYNRFVELMPRVLLPLCWYLNGKRGTVTGISFIDATPLPVCHNLRIKRHKSFAGLAGRSKTSVGWFYGFKLHLVVNDRGELLSFFITSGNVDDRKPVPHLMKEIFGKVFADKGYLSQALFAQLFAQNIQLITSVKKNMKNRLMTVHDKILLRKRALIETINDQLKNVYQIAHTRHRSVNNFLVNVVAALIAYSLQPKKPSLRFSPDDLALLHT